MNSFLKNNLFLKTFCRAVKQPKNKSLLYPLPYTLNGLQDFHLRNRKEHLDMDNKDDLILNTGWLFKFKISKLFEKYLDEIYSLYILNLYNHISHQENSKNQQNVQNHFMDNQVGVSLRSSFSDLFKQSAINFSDYSYFHDNNIHNTYILDKIIFHLNIEPENRSELKDNYQIRSINPNYFNRNLIEIKYSPKFPLKTRSTNFIIRFSVWVKASTHLLLFQSKNSKLTKKIHDDEYHHMLLELYDNFSELNFLSIFSNFSLPGLMNLLINADKKPKKVSLKLCDFDFHLKGDPLTNDSGKNELYYLKHY
jgi:hypothetical protein